jgi:protein gp37
MTKTTIQWTEYSVNPIRARNKLTGAVGHYCRKIAPECANCYASDWQPRFKMPRFQNQVRMIRDDSIEVFFDDKRLLEVLKRRKPTKWFWCDMTDMFGDWVPDEWIDRCFAVMRMTPHHTHQVLTKRPERMRDYLSEYRGDQLIDAAKHIWPERCLRGDHVGFLRQEELPPNIWPGVSAGTEDTVNRYVRILLEIDAAVRWLSAEPLLEEINLKPFLPLALYFCPNCGKEKKRNHCAKCFTYGNTATNQITGLDWVVLGGESGHNARPFVLGYGKEIVRQCKAAGVPVFVKQVGSYPTNREFEPCPHIKHRKGADMAEWPEELMIREFPTSIDRRIA